VPQETARRKVLSRLLSQLGWRSQVRGTRTAVALAADSLVLQLLDLPQHVPANIGEFVKGELQQCVALSGKNVISDFSGVSTGVQKRVLAVAADAGEIEEKLEACGATDLAVEAVEPAILAHARALLSRRSQARQDGDVLVALLGPRTLTMALYLRGTLDFLRVRSAPADRNTPSLLGAWLAEELQAVERYYDACASGARCPWQTCVVIDEGALPVREMKSALRTEDFKTPVVIVGTREPWPACPATQEGEVSTVAVGAALGLLMAPGEGLRINLLPRTVTQARSLSQHVLATVLAGVLVFLGLFVTAQLLARTTAVLDRKIEQTQCTQELYRAPAVMIREKTLDQEIAQLQHRAGPLRKALANRQAVEWSAVLEAVKAAAPAGVSVTQWQCDDGRIVSLQGLTPSCPAAQVFVQNLGRQKPFASSWLAVVQRQPDTNGRLEYRIDCLLKEKGGLS
jgi:Tfp pilus assembly protein PilN